MGKNSILGLFFPKDKKISAEAQSPPQELEIGPRSKPYLLVHSTVQCSVIHSVQCSVGYSTVRFEIQYTVQCEGALPCFMQISPTGTGSSILGSCSSTWPGGALAATLL